VFATKELVEKEDYVFEFVRAASAKLPAFLMKFNLMTSLPNETARLCHGDRI